MRSPSAILSGLALTGVLILFVLFFTGRRSAPSQAKSPAISAGSGYAHLAYVNVDSFNARYEFVKTKNAEFQKRQNLMEAELQRSAAQFENTAREYQRQMQAGTMSQAEFESAQKRLGQMQQSLQLREQALSDQLLKEKEGFNTDLQKQLDNFLTEYSKDKNYDFVLSYSSSLPMILYANKALDITEDVIKGMNEKIKSVKDTATKK